MVLDCCVRTAILNVVLFIFSFWESPLYSPGIRNAMYCAYIETGIEGGVHVTVFFCICLWD